MSKRMKRLSALLMAGVMSLNSGALASAANMSIYVREYNKDGSKTYTTPAGEAPVAVISTEDGDTIYSALTERDVISGEISSQKWTEGKNQDGTVDYYLTEFGVPGFTGINSNSYSNLEYDSKGNIIHGVWTGSSWMWCYKGDTSYPDKAMSAVVCPTEDFSIVLSFDHDSMKW